jgi:hypothetical protein
MTETYFCSLPSEGDLVVFRDAAITYAACRRQGRVLRIQADGDAWDSLSWLGVEGRQAGSPEGLAYLDPERTVAAGVEVRPLPAWGSLPRPSLRSFRCQGFLPEAMFAALIRSSYGPDAMDFFPTRSELGFYFDEALLLPGQARWEEGYLEACQAFFMEELMPAELVRKSLDCLAGARREALEKLCHRFREELHGVTFLVASELVTLKPLAELLQALLLPGPPPAGLEELLQDSGEWDRDVWSRRWACLPGGLRQGLAEELCPGFAGQAEDILFTAGAGLLCWRAKSASEVLR